MSKATKERGIHVHVFILRRGLGVKKCRLRNRFLRFGLIYLTKLGLAPKSSKREAAADHQTVKLHFRWLRTLLNRRSLSSGGALNSGRGPGYGKSECISMVFDEVIKKFLRLEVNLTFALGFFFHVAARIPRL